MDRVFFVMKKKEILWVIDFHMAESIRANRSDDATVIAKANGEGRNKKTIPQGGMAQHSGWTISVLVVQPYLPHSFKLWHRAP